MKKAIFLILFFSSCHLNVEVVKPYQEYFDDSTYQTFQTALDEYQKGKYVLADSLFTIVINKSQSKLSISMPEEFNPYFYRGNNSFELENYKEAISDMEHVASDTTTNIHVLLLRTEAFKMLKQYDTSISICNKLLALKYDSMMILSERGICYYEKGEMIKACSDLKLSKKMGYDTAFLNKFLTACK